MPPSTALTPQEEAALAVAQAGAIKRTYSAIPPFMIIGSEPKVGKSTDSIYCLPNAMVLYSEGGMKTAYATVGWAPLDSDNTAKTILQATTEITKRIRAGDPKRGLQFKNDAGQTMWGVIIDDFTLKARQDLAEIEANPPKSRDGKVNKFAIWDGLNSRLHTVITICRELGMPAYFSCHLRLPGVDEETKHKIPGGPDIGSRAQSEKVAAWVDLIAYVVSDPTRIRWPHGLSVSTRGSSWLAGDRHNIVSSGVIGQAPTSPLNTGEVMRAAGYSMPRAPGLDEWMEPIVEFAVGELGSGKSEPVVLQEATQIAKSVRGAKLLPWQVVWMLRDIVDRHEIRTKSQRFHPLAAWGVTL